MCALACLYSEIFDMRYCGGGMAVLGIFVNDVCLFSGYMDNFTLFRVESHLSV